MKQYKKLLIFPAIIIVIMTIFSGFANAPEHVLIEDMLTTRTNIMQRCLYGEISLEEAEKKLSEIETGILLDEDVKGLDNNEDTEIDPINTMFFESVTETRNYFEYNIFEVVILWNFAGSEGNYNVRETYNVVVKSIGNNYKLLRFDPL